MTHLSISRWAAALRDGGDVDISQLAAFSPGMGMFRTVEGRWVALASVEDKFWLGLCRALELYALGEPPYDEHAARMRDRAELRRRAGVADRRADAGRPGDRPAGPRRPGRRGAGGRGGRRQPPPDRAGAVPRDRLGNAGRLPGAAERPSLVRRRCGPGSRRGGVGRSARDSASPPSARPRCAVPGSSRRPARAPPGRWRRELARLRPGLGLARLRPGVGLARAAHGRGRNRARPWRARSSSRRSPPRRRASPGSR